MLSLVEPDFARAKVYAINDKTNLMNVEPFAVLLWSDNWLPCTEMIYYRRPYAIKNQRKARNNPNNPIISDLISTLVERLTVVTCHSWPSCPGSDMGDCGRSTAVVEADSEGEGSRQPGISGSQCSPGCLCICPLSHGSGIAGIAAQSNQ